ncbi:Transformer-2 protein like protein alpha [Fasciola gigantica]|uniref:Transformer-2 protein like protein alpha n=1 Tax=Fasciola gigantica TaxID=46835 RepID=A0A504YKJ6_FASGI|nr:Transformer-2 protein like protein alpha [Fasciola gigantica]
MPFAQSPDMDRRTSRHEDYSARTGDRDFPSEYDNYRRSRTSFEDRRSRQHEPAGYDSKGARDSYNRMDYTDRRSRPAGPPSPRFSGDGRPRGGPSGATPKPSRVLGVFGLSLRTEERHLYDIMSAYGAVEDIQIVYDSLTGRSRGFAFVYFQNMEDARTARAACADGLELHDRVLRVDYSMTTGPHQPTPGVYMGKDKRRNVPNRMRRYGYSDRRSYRRSRSRTPTPRRRNGSNDYGGGYRRRSRVVSSSRSRSPPPVYGDHQANGQRSSRSRSITQREPVRYSGPPKADDQWSDRSGSFH